MDLKLLVLKETVTQKMKKLEIHLSRIVEGFEGVSTSSIYCNDARSQKVYAKCCLLKLNDLIIPLINKNGQYETLEDVFILSSKL